MFTTLSELNAAIEERVREIDHDIRCADDTTRWERFQTEEAAFLGPLPDAGRNGILCRSRWQAGCCG
ncbi:hypothetical protein [Rhodoglobus aureus]|uniref:Uncharacterized protein n=1 Tax=Rhodoglobus aureus TaxID=191497 RepID=A0ABP4GMX6_9MICO